MEKDYTSEQQFWKKNFYDKTGKLTDSGEAAVENTGTPIEHMTVDYDSADEIKRIETSERYSNVKPIGMIGSKMYSDEAGKADDLVKLNIGRVDDVHLAHRVAEAEGILRNEASRANTLYRAERLKRLAVKAGQKVIKNEIGDKKTTDYNIYNAESELYDMENCRNKKELFYAGIIDTAEGAGYKNATDFLNKAIVTTLKDYADDIFRKKSRIANPLSFSYYPGYNEGCSLISDLLSLEEKNKALAVLKSNKEIDWQKFLWRTQGGNRSL